MSLVAAPLVWRRFLIRTFQALADDRQTDDLNSRIANARAAEQARAGGTVLGKPAKGYSQGSRVLAMLLGALFGGGVLGWAIDQWFGTSPWGLLIVLTLAVIGAFMNIIKMSKERAE
ncbi:AtpZ/AtpI family protein [Sphingomonas sp. GB1N7]|uniref:AtpZ/AtpI family protein n=1 Tax=Parasphingomonas caseinilytica TaxID=3096158 RepID=UPI002FCBC015